MYLFAAVADDARPQSERMSNMAMMVKKVTVILLCLAALPCVCRADLKEDFRGVFFSDCTNGRHTVQRRMAMFERRKGTWRVNIVDGDDGLPFFRRNNLRAMYIRVSETNRASMFFEDSQRRFVSSPELMNGNLSDSMFFWGGSVGVLAEYGVVEDVMPLTISPFSLRRHYFLRRTDESVSDDEIVCLDSVFCGISSAPPRDYVRVICGSDENAEMLAQCRENPGNPRRRKVVACYSMSIKGMDLRLESMDSYGIPKCDSQKFASAGWLDLLVVFYCDGTSAMVFRRFDNDNWYYYKLWFMVDVLWYDQFQKKDVVSAWHPDGDVLIQDGNTFGVSSRLDVFLRYPKDVDEEKAPYRRAYLKEKGEVAAAVMAYLKCPEKFCVHHTYHRMNIDGKDVGVRKALEKLWECMDGSILCLEPDGTSRVWYEEWK